MSSERPLMQMSIQALEEFFTLAKSKGDMVALADLRHELAFRQVPRALTLKQKLQGMKLPARAEASPAPAAVAAATGETSWGSRPGSEQSGPGSFLKHTASQADLLQGLDVPIFNPARQPAIQDLVAPAVSTAPGRPSGSPLAPAGQPMAQTELSPHTTQPKASSAKAIKAWHEGLVLPQISLEDAYKVLKVAPNDTWDKVESARRKLVLNSSPGLTKGLAAAQVQNRLADAKVANDAATVIAAGRSGWR